MRQYNLVLRLGELLEAVRNCSNWRHWPRLWAAGLGILMQTTHLDILMLATVARADYIVELGRLSKHAWRSVARTWNLIWCA